MVKQQTGPSFFPSQQLLFTRQFVTSPSSCQRSSLRPPWKSIRCDHFQKFSILFVLFYHEAATVALLWFHGVNSAKAANKTLRVRRQVRGDLRSLIRHRLDGCLRWLFTNDYTKCFHSLLITECEKVWCVSGFALGNPLAVSSLPVGLLTTINSCKCLVCKIWSLFFRCCVFQNNVLRFNKAIKQNSFSSSFLHQVSILYTNTINYKTDKAKWFPSHLGSMLNSTWTTDFCNAILHEQQSLLVWPLKHFTNNRWRPPVFVASNKQHSVQKRLNTWTEQLKSELKKKACIKNNNNQTWVFCLSVKSFFCKKNFEATSKQLVSLRAKGTQQSALASLF